MTKVYNRRPFPPSNEEDQFLRDNLSMSNRELAERLNLTVPLVKSRLLALNLRREKARVVDLPGEEWRPVLAGGPYSVSSLGRVRNNDRLGNRAGRHGGRV